MEQRFFVNYTIGDDAFLKFHDVCKPLGKNVLILGGKKALNASIGKLKNAIGDEFNIINTAVYGTECCDLTVNMLYEEYKDTEIDFIVGVGGGKALDTAKYLADVMKIPVITVPTIASTCAASSALSVVYTENHVFQCFRRYKKPAYHCFIDTSVISAAPSFYFRAGLGDTLAKYYEVEFSSRGRALTYSDEMAISISRMCNKPLLDIGKKALEDCINHNLTPEFQQAVLIITVSTGMESMLINGDYNGAMAHALFYGFTVIKGFEEKFLHGDVVGYCTGVQLVLDGKDDEARYVFDFLRSIGVETTLKQRGILLDKEYLDSVLESALNDPDMEVIPYKVTKEMIFNALVKAEKMEEKAI